jgi:uncharacterized damage-inducible protein DinB
MASQTPNIFLRPREEPGTQGHLDLVEPLQALPRQVAEAIAGLSRDELRYRADEGGWCIQEIVGHLRDACEVYHKRIYMMSTQTDPILQPYDPDAYAKEHGYLDRSPDDMLADIKLFRTQTVALLTSLVNWNWARTGQHLEDGRISIRQIVEHMIEHEAEHLSDIRSLRVAAIAAG